MSNPGKEEEKGGEKLQKLRWILFIINLVMVIGGGANAIYRARGDRLDLINMVLMFSSLLGLIVCNHIQDGRERKGKTMIAMCVFIIVLWGNVGWICAREFEFGAVGQIVCPLVFVFALLAFFLFLDKCCSSKEASVIPVED